MVKRRTRATKSKRTGDKYVVTATFKLTSTRVSRSKAQELISRVKAKGGTATVRKA